MKLKSALFLAAIAGAAAILYLLAGKDFQPGLVLTENKKIEEAFI